MTVEQGATPSVSDIVAKAAQAIAEGTGPENTGTGDITQTPEQTTTEITPLEYQELLDALPESLVPLFKPVAEKFYESQRSKYTALEDELKPWKDLGVDAPDDVKNALSFAESFDTDPLGVYQALEKHLLDTGLLEVEEEKTTKSETKSVAKASDAEEEELDPQFASLKAELAELKELMSGMTKAQQEQLQKAQEDQQQIELEDYLKDLASRHGELDNDYIIAKLMNGVDGEAAAKEWRALVDGIKAGTAGPKPGDISPTVLGGGGSLPSNRIADIAKMDRPQVNQLVTDYLEAASKA